MLEENGNVRGYAPPAPTQVPSQEYQTPDQNIAPETGAQGVPSSLVDIWRALDHGKLALLGAGLYGLIYALLTIFRLWWYMPLFPHFIVTLCAVGANAYTIVRKERLFALVSGAGYLVSALLFLNQALWLIVPIALCAFAWWDMRDTDA